MYLCEILQLCHIGSTVACVKASYRDGSHVLNNEIVPQHSIFVVCLMHFNSNEFLYQKICQHRLKHRIKTAYMYIVSSSLKIMYCS